MARPVFNIKHCSLFKIQFISSKKKKNSAITLGCSLFQWFFYTATLIFCHSSLANGRCENTAATLESVEGVVEWSIADDHWQQATRGDAFCYGDKIRILEQRAALRLANDTVVRLRENSVVTLMPEDKGFWVELVQGAGHFLSRTPKQLTIKAAYLNAAIDGTEFVVAVEDQRNRVAVFEGDVRVFNRYGEVRLGEGTETSATATTAPDPARSIRLHDAAEWILHYPPLIIQNQIDATISALMDQERYADALNRLDRQTMTSEETTLAASLALISGQPSMADRLLNLALQQNPQSPEARALQALKALTAGNDQAALSQTSALLQTDPQNISVLLAHAYALQSQGKIEEALKTNRQALSVAPDNLFILARTAELELSSGNTRAAHKLIDRALQKAPNHSRVNTLAGFIALNRFANKEAQTYFRTAINSNDSEPLARLGLALALIQKGKIEQGRAEMEMAVLLDPGSSLLRSYLGKTYAALDQNDWADTQYQLAKNLDPNDPTPWFYQAHLKHEENKPGEALKLITTAIEKNDNRAVYRSRMLLDSDAAARSANLAGIYKNLGFNETAKQTAALAASKNPTDFAAHKALTTAYYEDPNSHVLRAREAFMARLLAPPGTDELPVGTGETSLVAPPWILPSQMGTHNYAPLFAQQGLAGRFSSTMGNNNSRAYQWQLQAKGNRTSMTGGQFDYKTNGFRANNDLDTNFREGTVQHQFNNDTKLQINHSSLFRDAGDFRNNIHSSFFNESERETGEIKNYSISTASALPASHKLLMLATRTNIDRSHSSQNYYDEYWLVNDSNQEKAENLLYQTTLFGTEKKYWYRIMIGDESFDSQRLRDLVETYDGEPLSDTETRISIASNHQIMYGQFVTGLDPDLQFAIGAGHIWADLTITENSTNNIQSQLNSSIYDAGLRWQPSEMLSISLASWDRTERRLPITDSLDRGMIFDIRAADNTAALARNSASALTLTLRHTDKSIIIKTKHTKIVSPIGVFSPHLLRIGTSQVNKSNTIIHMENAINDVVSAQFSSHYEKQEPEYQLRSINSPFRTKSIVSSASLNWATTQLSTLRTELVYVDHQSLIAGETAQAGHTTQKDSGFITNIDYTLNFNKGQLGSSIKAMNIFNKKINIYHQDLDAQSESLIPTQKEISENRSIFFCIFYQF